MSKSIFGLNDDNEAEVDIDGFKQVKNGLRPVPGANTVNDRIIHALAMKNKYAALSESVNTPPCMSSLSNRRKHGEEVSSPVEDTNSADKYVEQTFPSATELYSKGRQASISPNSCRPAATPVAGGRRSGRKRGGAGG